MSPAVPGKSSAVSDQCHCLKSAEVRCGTPPTPEQLLWRLPPPPPPLGDGLPPSWQYNDLGAVLPAKMGLGRTRGGRVSRRGRQLAFFLCGPGGGRARPRPRQAPPAPGPQAERRRLPRRERGTAERPASGGRGGRAPAAGRPAQGRAGAGLAPSGGGCPGSDRSPAPGAGLGAVRFPQSRARNVAPWAGRPERDRPGGGRWRPPEEEEGEEPERDGARGAPARPAGGRSGGPGSAAAGAERGATPGELTPDGRCAVAAPGPAAFSRLLGRRAGRDLLPAGVGGKLRSAGGPLP